MPWIGYYSTALIYGNDDDKDVLFAEKGSNRVCTNFGHRPRYHSIRFQTCSRRFEDNNGRRVLTNLVLKVYVLLVLKVFTVVQYTLGTNICGFRQLDLLW